MPVMDRTQKLALVETSLERTADQLGDITNPVIERYYAMHPDARASFDEHGLGNAVKLETEMVDSVLYCLMNWIDRPEEIRIMFGRTVPHHEETLHVHIDWFGGLVDAAVQIIMETIPESRRDEREVWTGIHRELTDLIRDAQN